MVQIGARIAPAGRAVAAVLERAGVGRVAGVAQVDGPPRRERLTRAPRARGQHAIHHVDPAQDRAHDIIGLAHAHEVTRPVGGQHGGRVVENLEHCLLPLTHGKPPDRVAVKADRAQRLGAFGAQLAREAALLDPEQRMPRPLAEGISRPLRPAHREAHRLRDPRLIRRQGGAFVEGHHDVRAEQALDLHAALGREVVGRAVDVRLEAHPLLVELAQPRKAHHLKPARVGQDRPRPVHESVQATQCRDPLGAWAQHQVIGVAKQDVGARRRDAFGQHRLDGRGRAHGHEGGRADRAARRLDQPRARAPVRRRHRKGKTSHPAPPAPDVRQIAAGGNRAGPGSGGVWTRGREFLI